GAASLARAISAWAGPEDKPEVEVRCGSAISVDRDKFVAACEPARVGFKATVLPYPVVMSGLLDYLKGLNGGARLGKVALLHESSTTFGQSVNRKKEGESTPKADPDFSEYFVDDGYTIISYPLHISQVAIAYSDRKDHGQDTQANLARPSSRLQVPFD